MHESRTNRPAHAGQGGKHRTGPGSGGVEAVGVLDSRNLPDPDFNALWDAIILDQEQKDRILAQAILNFTIRPKVDRAQLPMHGLILLHGPPGTGKTSIARALASRVAEAAKVAGTFLYIEVEPHALTSAAHGKTQKAVKDLLGLTVAEHAASGPLVVVLDEVETLAADRSKMSLEANPIDVHRATDAVLAQLDHLAAAHPKLLFIATSNFTRALDQAFLSRADLVEYVGPPNAKACRTILTAGVKALAAAYPKVESNCLARLPPVFPRKSAVSSSARGRFWAYEAVNPRFSPEKQALDALNNYGRESLGR
jgi:AAA+ superfamily predicted ATPase